VTEPRGGQPASPVPWHFLYFFPLVIRPAHHGAGRVPHTPTGTRPEEEAMTPNDIGFLWCNVIDCAGVVVFTFAVQAVTPAPRRA